MPKELIIPALTAALAEVQKEATRALKKGDYTNARKYTTTCRHLNFTLDLMGKKNA